MKKLFFLLLLCSTPAFITQSKAQSSEPENMRTKKDRDAFDLQEEKRIKAENSDKKNKKANEAVKKEIPQS